MASIDVFARLRPTHAQEASPDVTVLDQSGILVRNLEFSLDHVFDSDASQHAVYERVGNGRVTQVVGGLNVCMIAYGQTGSGKTHTMFGPDSVLTSGDLSANEQHGLALRAISDLFDAVHNEATSKFNVACSYLEVYNDQVNDLLAGKKEAKKAVPIREGQGGITVEGMTYKEVQTMEQAMEAFREGNAARTTAQMKMNARSSRSHAIFTVHLKGSSEVQVSAGKLVLVDLAGMESSKKSFSVCILARALLECEHA